MINGGRGRRRNGRWPNWSPDEGPTRVLVAQGTDKALGQYRPGHCETADRLDAPERFSATSSSTPIGQRQPTGRATSAAATAGADQRPVKAQGGWKGRKGPSADACRDGDGCRYLSLGTLLTEANRSNQQVTFLVVCAAGTSNCNQRNGAACGADNRVAKLLSND